MPGTSWRVGLCCALLGLAAVGCRPLVKLVPEQHSVEGWGRDMSVTMSYGGEERTFELHLPPSLGMNRAVPLVMVLHGGGGTGQSMMKLTGFNERADRHGFVVAYPNAVDKHWNDGKRLESIRAYRENIDDVGFLTALIRRLAAEYPIDRRRIYVTGISNGGGMTLRMACERAQELAAVAAVEAAMNAELAGRCKPAVPLPLLLINGTEDSFVPWGGGMTRFLGKEMGVLLSVPDTLNVFVKANRCREGPALMALPDRDPNDGTRVEKWVYGECAGGSEVVLFKIIGGGHTWAGGWQYLPAFMVGKTSREVHASDIIWDFFSRFRRE